MYFIAVLNTHLGDEKIISKNAMSEFYNNISMQALSKQMINFLLILMQ